MISLCCLLSNFKTLVLNMLWHCKGIKYCAGFQKVSEFSYHLNISTWLFFILCHGQNNKFNCFNIFSHYVLGYPSIFKKFKFSLIFSTVVGLLHILGFYKCQWHISQLFYILYICWQHLLQNMHHISKYDLKCPIQAFDPLCLITHSD